jgi:hypothetical protein
MELNKQLGWLKAPLEIKGCKDKNLNKISQKRKVDTVIGLQEFIPKKAYDPEGKGKGADQGEVA